ncbi:MAG: ABC transporter substrate-binding protein, partial [Candidatus Firestonebacteria bacterium]
MKNSTYKYARIALVLLALGFPVCCPALPAALDPIETLKSMEVTEKEPEASISTASTVVSLIRAEIKFPEAKIGFIGPLSGDNAEYGEKVRNGIALAISKFNAEHNSSVEFVACDSKDDSETAIKFLRSFSTDPKAVAVVGPVTGASLEEIIKTCNMLELPVITPTVFFSGELPGNRFFFRNNLSPADEGSSIAGYALNTLKLKKFAVLRTNSLYSRLCFEA